MKKLFGIIVLMSLCAHGMEQEQESKPKKKDKLQAPQGKLMPYTEREEIGRMHARVLDGKDFPVDPTTRTFYVMGGEGKWLILRRIPLIVEGNGVLWQLKQAFDSLVNKNTKRDISQIVNRKHGIVDGVKLYNIDEQLPLFMDPGVTFKKVNNTWTVTAENHMRIDDWSPGKSYFSRGGPSPDRYNFFAYATRLQAAVLCGDWKLIEALIQHGADQKVCTSSIQRTPRQLLIDLARYEQEQIGLARSFAVQTIEAYQDAAEAFAGEQWDSMIAANMPTRYNNARNALMAVGPTIKPVIKPAILVLFALVVFLFINGASKVPEL